MKISYLFAGFFLCLFTLSREAQSQIFTPITLDYNCAQFPDGAQYLTKVSSTGYSLVDSKSVIKGVNAQKKVLNGRLKVLKDTLKGFKAARIARSKLIKTANKAVAKLFGEENTIPSELQPDAAEVAVGNVIQRIILELQTQQTKINLINECESGVNPKTKGSVIGVTVEPISLASSNTIYGGFVLHTSKIKNSGFNVCLKLIYPDGSIGKFYTGFGDDYICGTGTSKFEGVPQSICKTVIPKGNVGYVIQKRSYAFVSLPDKTTAELLDQMRLEVQADRPLVGVLAFPFNLSRDASVKACEAF